MIEQPLKWRSEIGYLLLEMTNLSIPQYTNPPEPYAWKERICLDICHVGRTCMMLASSLRCKINFQVQNPSLTSCLQAGQFTQGSWGDLELNIKRYDVEFITSEFSNLKIKDVGQVSNLEPCSG